MRPLNILVSFVVFGLYRFATLPGTQIHRAECFCPAPTNEPVVKMTRVKTPSPPPQVKIPSEHIYLHGQRSTLKVWDIGITMWTVPRPFEGEVGKRQRASIESWLRLKPQPEVLLVGDEEGIDEAAAQLGCSVKKGLTKTRFNTVLLDDAFRLAEQAAKHRTLVYVNSDIFFDQQWMTILQRVLAWAIPQKKPYLVVGPRILVKKGLLFDRKKDEWSGFWRSIVEGGKEKSNLNTLEISAEDYFVYEKGSMHWMPPFHLGRYVWDNHIVSHARRKGFTIVSGWNEQRGKDPLFFGLHFEHDRSHQSSGSQKKLRGYNERISKKNGGWEEGTLIRQNWFIGRCDGDLAHACIHKRKKKELPYSLSSVVQGEVNI